MSLRLLLLLLVASLAACGGGGGGGDEGPRPIVCTTFEELRDGRCVIVPTGVLPEHCAPGFVYDSANGSCEPTLPPSECGAGTMPVIGKSECVPVGVGTCAAGFVSDGTGGCNVVLPAAKCAAGTMAVPGEKVCRAVAACGAGTWGDIPIEASTLHVDASYTGGANDGSSARPFKTIQNALDAASGSPIIAIAAGKYVESLRIVKPVRLFGVCPSRTEVQAVDSAEPALRFTNAANGAVVRGVAVTGVGIRIDNASITFEQTWVHDTGGYGFDLVGAMTKVTIGSSLVEQATRLGISVSLATVTLEKSVVRDTRAAADGTVGRGIHVERRSTMTVRASVVERNRETGIGVFASNVTIEGSVVRDTQPQTSDKSFGHGIYAQADAALKARSVLVVRGSLIEGSRDLGVAVFGSDATFEDSVVRDTQPRLSDGSFGVGIYAEVDARTKERSLLVVRRSVVERNHEHGIDVFGSDATIEATVVRDTRSRGSDKKFGRGINIESDATTKSRAVAKITASLFERNREMGIADFSADVTVEGCVVRDTLPQALDERYGHGIGAEVDIDSKMRPKLVVRGTIVERNHYMGIIAFGADVTIEGSLVRATKPMASNGEYGGGIGALIDDNTNERSVLSLRSTLVADTFVAGVFVAGSEATIEGTLMRDTRPQVADGFFGDGLVLVPALGFPSSVVMKGSASHGSARAGVAVFASSLTLERSRLTCNGFDLDLEPVDAMTSSLGDGGGNLCGCAPNFATCKAATARLGAAPPPR